MVKRERILSWVDQQGIGNSSLDINNAPGPSGTERTPSPVQRDEASHMESSQNDDEFGNKDELEQLQALKEQLGLTNQLVSLPDPTEEPPRSDSDSGSGTEYYHDAENGGDGQGDPTVAIEPEVFHYAGVLNPPKASTVAIGPLKYEKMKHRLRLPGHLKVS